MANSSKHSIIESVKTGWFNLMESKKKADNKNEYASREKLIVFSLAFILALCLWFLINLSRTFNLTINVPIELGTLPPDQALTERLPEFASVSVEGEGWSLINFYNNPPELQIDVKGGQVNLIDQVREQMNMLPGVHVQKVQPAILSANLEERVTRKKKVIAQTDISFAGQFNLLDSLDVSPDSVTISGASSIVDNIRQLETELLELNQVSSDINQFVNLISPHELVDLNRQQVKISGRVTEFTEGEIRALIRVTGAPAGQEISFSPSVITIRYNVPIQEYAQAQDMIPFTAVVPYEAIKQDSTGFIRPNIVPNTDQLHVRLRSYQPQQVAYFRVLNN